MIKAIGADPELFLRDPEEDLNIPAIGIVGGTKANPRRISDKGHAVQEDNVMAEFNIPPSETEDEFVENIQYALDFLEADIPEPLELVVTPTLQFPAEFLQEEQAQIAGCDPFINAWSGDVEEVEVCHTNMRSSGGHIHVSYEEPTEKKSREIVKYLDLTLGVPSILLDSDRERKKTYGVAGACRYKEYGVEYRTLSNFWIANERLMRWIYKNTHLAYDLWDEGERITPKVRRCIDTSNKRLAEQLIEEYDIPL